MCTLKLVFILIVLIQFLEMSLASVDDIARFQSFKLKFAKHYLSDEEHQQRFQIFLRNAEHINKHNLRYAAGLVTFKLAVNEYADMTPEEFQETYWTRTSYSDLNPLAQGATFIPPFNFQPPKSIDWRELGAVTPVKQQGKCGSCWAFAATGALEGQHFRKTSKLIALSEQNLVDCVPNQRGEDNCKGNFQATAYTYVRDNDGIATEESYPYQAIANPECHFNTSTIGTVGRGFVTLPKGDEDAIAIAVATVGPVSASLFGKCLNLQFYQEGVFNDLDCGPTAPLKHAVLIVGYGYDEISNMDYWIIKNSWGDDWGMNGYVQIPRSINYAGVGNRASYPLV